MQNRAHIGLLSVFRTNNPTHKKTRRAKRELDLTVEAHELREKEACEPVSNKEPPAKGFGRLMHGRVTKLPHAET